VNASIADKITKDPKYPTKPNDNIVQANPARILNRECPAIIFAKSRTEILIARNIYEINSIPINPGTIHKGHPGGTKKLKKCNPCVEKPTNVIATKTVIPILKVTNK